MNVRRQLIAAMAVAAAVGAAGPASAATIPCDTTLSDASGASWPIISSPMPSVMLDATALGWTSVGINNGFISFGAVGECSSQMGGRQIASAAVDHPTGPIQLTRKVYVPTTGTGFARIVDTVRNTSDTPVTVTLWADQYSDAGLQVVGTSSGDTTIDVADDWVSTKTAFPHAVMLHGVGGTAPDQMIDGLPTLVRGAWNDVTVPAGEQRSWMQIVVQGAAGAAGESAVADAATQLGVLPKDTLVGMTKAELTGLVNWSVPSTDTDGDEVLDAADLCPTVVGTDWTGCDHRGPAVTVSAPKSMTRAAFLRGVPVTVGCSEACSARVRLVARASSEGRLMSTMRVLLAEVKASLGTTTKRVSPVPRKRLVVSRTSFTAYVKVMVTDASGNVSYATKRVHVG